MIGSPGEVQGVLESISEGLNSDGRVLEVLFEDVAFTLRSKGNRWERVGEACEEEGSTLKQRQEASVAAAWWLAGAIQAKSEARCPRDRQGL